MPCYEVRLTSVEFKAKHKDLLLKALRNIGMYQIRKIGDNIIEFGNLSFNLKFEKVSLPEDEAPFLNRVKVQYSKECIQEAAKKKKWLLKKLANNKFQAKRY